MIESCCCRPLLNPPEIRDERELQSWIASSHGDRGRGGSIEYLLRESHSLYDGRGTAAVIRMRGWLLLALGEEDLGSTALPFVLEELESGHDAYLTAAAAAVLRRTEARPELVPALLAGLLYIRFRDDSVSLSEYGGYGVGGERTTAVTEILLTLESMGSAARSALPRLRAMRQEKPLATSLAKRLDEVIAALDEAPLAPSQMPTKTCCSMSSSVGAQSSPPSMESLATFELQDQEGASLRFGDFFRGQPSLVVFFYTRCDNPTKCALTITRLGRMQRLLRAQGLEAAIATAAITYDPGFDVPARLARYAETWGAEPGGIHKMLRAVDDFARLRDYFDLGVNYVGTVVNRHQIEAFVLDAQGQIVTAATRLQWDEAEIVAAARALLDEV